MKKFNLLMLFSILCIIIAIAPAFALDNDTSVNVENDYSTSVDYYFDANVENDLGNGSVYNPYKELTSDRMPDKSVIHLANGEYTLKGSKSYKNLTIIGEDSERTIVKYADAVGFTSTGSLVLKNVTLLKLKVSISQNANLTATNVIFKSSTSSTSVIASSTNGNAVVVLDNCSFYGNSAQYGGTINLQKSKLNITNSRFMANHAEYWGGAIACDDVDVYMAHCRFADNYATQDVGGAIYLKDSNMIANNLEMVNCSAMMGGAIMSLNSALNLNNCIATNNQAKYYGGAVYKMYTSFELSNSHFNNNSALNGGALFVDNVADFKIMSNYFANNRATSTGGAIYSIVSDSYYDIIDKHLNNVFINNEANLSSDVYQSEFVDIIICDDDYLLIRCNSSYEGSLPSRYDLRELGLVTPVRNQGKGGNCWSFSALAALESALLKATNTTYDLSEENMKNIASKYSEYGWTMETNTGGYDKMAVGYLAAWLGPVNESEDAYSPTSLISPLLDSDIHIQNIIFLTRKNSTDNDAIKRAIMEYGAVSTSLYWGSADGKNYYYNGNSGANHAVAIVGWDDNYSASNFKNKPEGDGAWIIKNSWGSGSGENGFYYASYYDTRLAQVGKYVTYAFVLNSTIRYDKNYQYDLPGRTDYFLNETDTVWYKVRYTATDDEFLTAVSTYFEKATDWDLSVYVNDVLRLTQSGSASPSYRTIDLNSIIPLKLGDVFEIVFKIKVDGDVGVPISEFVSLNSEMYTENVSFISYDGKNWADLYELEWTYPSHTYESQVACIKAFTILNPIRSIIDLAVAEIKNGAADIICTVSDEYGNLIKSGEVTFTANGIQKTIPVVNGIAKLVNVNINEGINRFNARFAAVGYSDSSDFVLVSSSPVATSISLDFLSNLNPYEIMATVLDENGNPVESGEVLFSIDGNDYAVMVLNGTASLNHTFQTVGLKSVNAVYSDKYCYAASSAQINITVSNEDTSIAISFDGQYNPVGIIVRVTDSNGSGVNQGIVTFNVDGKYYAVNVNDGTASLNHVFEEAGVNFVGAAYFDDSYAYKSCEDEKSVVVLLKPTSIELNLDSGDTVHNPVNITATVVDLDNESVKTGKVVFSVGGENIVTQIENGKSSISYVFENEGEAKISVQYIDSTYYDVSSKSVTVNVSKINVELSVTAERYARDVNITMAFSEPINEYVTVYVNGTKYIVKTKNGSAVIRLFNLANGQYNVKTHVESSRYSCPDESIGFEVRVVSTRIVCSDEIYYLNRDIIYPAFIMDETGSPVSGYPVNLTVGGRTITAISDSSGKCAFKLNLTEIGSYDVQIDFKGDDCYLKSSQNRTVTVKSTIVLPEATRYTYNSQYSFDVLDSKGNGLKNKMVHITVGGNEQTVSTDSIGNAYYTVNLNPGTYDVSITNPETGEVKSQTIEVVARMTENKDLTMYYGAGSSYKVRVWDDNGNAATGVSVTFKINGNTYTRTTDSNGYASFKITLNPKTYTITATYKGYKVSNKVVVKPTLVCKEMTVKKSMTFKYTVKLLNSKGKIIKGKYVKVKFKGKTYKAKTNSKGIATFKIKLNSKTGKFTLTATYGSAKVTKKITVKK